MNSLGTPGDYSGYKSFYQGRRVFLTGHTGFKGVWLARVLLGLGAEVTGYALAPPAGGQLV